MVKLFQALSVALLLSLLSACSRTVDACPAGMVREGDRCVAEEPAEPGSIGYEGEIGYEHATEDSPWGSSRADDIASEDPPSESDSPTSTDAGSGGLMPASLDASAGGDVHSVADYVQDGDALVANPEAGSLRENADTFDANGEPVMHARDASAADVPSWSEAAVSGDALPDSSDATDGNQANVEAGEVDASLPPICSDGDLLSWRAFQTSNSLIRTIAGCYASDPRCATGSCDLAACLRRAAGVGGCVACVAEETRCALDRCASACSSSDARDTCRACACREGCIGGTNSCGMGAVNACGDCRGPFCRNMSLDPALIIVIVS